MRKILSLTVDKYHFAIQEELNDKIALKALKGVQEIKSTRLYSIVQTPRMYVNFDSFSIDKDYNISFSSYLPGIAGCAGMVLAAYMLLEMNFVRYILLAITIMVFFKLVFSFANRNQQSR